jgi:ribosome-binding protein aMBF1 (putative translation factor)
VSTVRGTFDRLGTKKRQSLDRREQDALRIALTQSREAAGLSKKELSLRLQRHHSFMSRIESGTRVIDVVEFWDIAAALGITPLELMARVMAALPKSDTQNPT